MKFEATPKTAVFTGLWTALGMSTVDAWERLHALDTHTHNILFMVAAALFLFIPVGLFVAGPQYFRFGLKGLMTKEYLLAFRAVALRGLCWFFGGGLGLIIFGLVESYFAT